MSLLQAEPTTGSRRESPSNMPPSRRGRTRTRTRVQWVAAVVGASVIALVATPVMGDGADSSRDQPGTEAEYVLDPSTRRPPSGSSFDAPFVQRSRVLDPRTDRVPSGSSFDARFVHGSRVLDPRTDRVPSGSAFDAPLSD